MASMCATVSFSVTLAPVAAQLIPVGLSTSFCGSMNTTAVSLGFQSISSASFLVGGRVREDISSMIPPLAADVFSVRCHHGLL
jgi:hypothetical protein